MLAIDRTGRATTYRAPTQPETLFIFLPDDRAADVLEAAAPAEPSPAQEATLALLVRRALSLS
jgi:hypothetical protein